MFSIRDWFSKKSASTETAEEGNSQKSKDSLEKAKHFAAIVDESIAKQNFSGLNQELSIIVDNGEKELVKRAQEKSRPKPINDVLNRGNESIQKIKGYSVLIKDKSVSRNLLKIGNIVSMIFREIEADPNCINSLSLFLNYYLPTTEKLLNAYADLCQKEPNAYLSQPKKEIENALGTIISAYEQILEKLYKEHEMSITTEIETLKLMLKQEGVSV